MGNIETTIDPENPDSITIDISDITSDQRRLLGKCIAYQETIPNPDVEGEMMANPISLIAALELDHWKLRQSQMSIIFDEEKLAEAQAEKASIMGDM